MLFVFGGFCDIMYIEVKSGNLSSEVLKVEKTEKNVYRVAREKLALSREKAAELTELDTSKIERIENEKTAPNPWDVIAMARAYKSPELCNYFCANECPIGMKCVPEIKIKDLSQIVLEMLASLNSMKKSQERLIEITADGLIGDDELADFIKIQEGLECISMTVDSLTLWMEKMMATGKINVEQYRRLKGE